MRGALVRRRSSTDDRAAWVDLDVGSLEPDSRGPRPTTGCDEDAIKGDGVALAIDVEDQLAGGALRTQHFARTRPKAYVNTVCSQTPGDQRARVGLLLEQQTIGELDERHAGPEARERLPELAPDRAAPEHHQALRQLTHPQTVSVVRTSAPFRLPTGGMSGSEPVATIAATNRSRRPSAWMVDPSTNCPCRR